jgi:hypothetical protein
LGKVKIGNIFVEKLNGLEHNGGLRKTISHLTTNQVILKFEFLTFFHFSLRKCFLITKNHCKTKQEVSYKGFKMLVSGLLLLTGETKEKKSVEPLRNIENQSKNIFTIKNSNKSQNLMAGTLP